MMDIADEEKISNIIASVNNYLFDVKLGGPRLNTNFQELKINLGRAFGFAFGHKENGAMFSHMTIMYIYALYQKKRVKEGWRLISTLFEHLCDFNTSLIYPNLPEYINQQGRGMYYI